MPKLHFNENAAPVIQELEDGTKVYRTVSAGAGCHKLGCGLRVFVKEGKITKIEGDPDHPISQGRLCVRCLTGIEYIYHKDRILYPMKRAREDRGKDKWERISWDEAYYLMISEYERIRDTYGIDSITCWNGTGREASQFAFPMTYDVFGSIQAVHPNSGWSCIVPRMALMLWSMGSSYIESDNACGLPGRYDDPAWTCPKYMLIWGRDPLRSNADGLFGHSIVDMMKRGMKLIVADPRANWLACRAEVHLQLRPGTDAALALSLINVVIDEDLYDHEFVDAWTYGFDALAERAREYSPERVGEICGIEPEDIRHAARCLAQSPSTLSMGLAVDQNPNCLQIAHALLSLFAILGDMDVPGGCFMGLPPNFAMAENKPTEEDVKEEELEGLALYNNIGRDPLGHDRFPAYSAITNNTVPDATLDTMETDYPYPLKFAYIFGHNAIANMVPQPKRWFEALRRMEFVAVGDLFMTPLIMGNADLVLPISSFLEHEGYINNSNGSQPGQIGAMIPPIEPLGECKSDLEIMIEMHHRLYPNSKKEGWATARDNINMNLAAMRGIEVTYEELLEHAIGQYEIEYKKYEKGMLRPDGSVGFNTPTGRIELYSTMLEKLGDDPLPYYIEPKFSPISRPDLHAQYPLIMTTGARHFTSFHSENRQIETLREIHRWPTMEIHPKTAAKLGIAEGSWVWVENQLGRAQMCAHLTPILKEDTVNCDHGWWLPESNPESLYEVFKYNINNLIPHEENGPLGFGTHYKAMMCKVYPAVFGEEA